jgi:hypothetical protein
MSPDQAAELGREVTHGEVARMTRAMKDSKFRDMFQDYVSEISDPTHRSEYLTYLAQLEEKGELPEGRCLLRSKPGACVETELIFASGHRQKLYINVCKTEKLQDIGLRV